MPAPLADPCGIIKGESRWTQVSDVSRGTMAGVPAQTVVSMRRRSLCRVGTGHRAQGQPLVALIAQLLGGRGSTDPLAWDQPAFRLIAQRIGAALESGWHRSLGLGSARGSLLVPSEGACKAKMSPLHPIRFPAKRGLGGKRASAPRCGPNRAGCPESACAACATPAPALRLATPLIDSSRPTACGSN